MYVVLLVVGPLACRCFRLLILPISGRCRMFSLLLIAILLFSR